jgi:hypothetical protein
LFLRGAFGEQAVHELYPKLLKRLDDSSDQVRLAACATIEMFLQCAPPKAYRYYDNTYMNNHEDQSNCSAQHPEVIIIAHRVI